MRPISERLEQTSSAPSAARALRVGTEFLQWPQWFAVNGRVEDTDVQSCWADGWLRMSPGLRQRCDLSIRMGDVFDGSCFEKSSQLRCAEGLAEFWRLSAGRARVEAGLSQPLPALLTSLRALDDVGSVEVGLPGQAGSWTWPPQGALRGS